MENLSLYDMLVGKFDSEGKYDFDEHLTYFRNMNEEQKLRSSIVENLKMILNTRRGSVVHLPDFGMPDVLQLYYDSGNSVEPVKKQIHDTILKYEPRIAEVKIDKYQFDQDSMSLSFKIVATIKEYSGKEILLTEFSTTGWTKVEFERDIK